MPTALFVSPHLDDAAFSCGGTAARLSRLGWRVALATVFTASVPEPQGFALACQTDKGIPAGVDYMALRRGEDAEACKRLGAEAIWLGYLEAPHRGYESARELFDGESPGDDIHHEVEDSLRDLILGLSPELVFGPQGLGGHVDHLQVIRSLDDVARQTQSLGDRLLYYRDTPYAIRDPRATPRLPDQGEKLSETAADIGEALPDKLASCAAYASQLGFQFGDERAMRESLSGFASAEGHRLGGGGPAESYLGTPSATHSLPRLP